ncbi:TRAP transporter permease [Psychromonas ossibalaenae]|uniref:TRAP transporter permease n=1 Tax=Psychromonas ossibalaenae TaxID=444922 RepID=UPI00035DBE28|nr:TRAP transporter permease [Psychromonas ossibalaenae]
MPNTQTSQQLQEMAANADSGARQPEGFSGKLISIIALTWALFQLWYASPLPFTLNIGIINDSQARVIHLSFAVFLAFSAFPAFKNSPRKRVPLQDWLFALTGAASAVYLFVFYQELSTRPGAPVTMDIVASVTGMLLLLEATRRALGPALMIVAGVFLVYIFAGPIMPEVISHRGASLAKAASHLWITSEGVFGIALGVSTSFVFLFVLFGALLEKAGAGNYFIKMAFALLGHMRGGPAKAAVLASGMTGLISGSSIANVVTTGTFTIPLMKRMGMPAEKAGAVEVASSCYGQIMPPIMGAAAFLMVEYVGIPYVDVIKHAFIPAIAAYLTFLYIMHLEALKANLKGIKRTVLPAPWKIRLLRAGITLSSLFILAGVVYFGLNLIQSVLGDTAVFVISILVLGAYIGLAAHSAKYPDLEVDDPTKPVESLPELGPTVKSGLHFLLPVIILVWCLMVEQLSPGLSAFYATAFMMFILVTQKPLFAFFRKQNNYSEQFKLGVGDLMSGLETGARNMIGIGVATAAAGIVVGAVTLTGLGPVMTELVEVLSGGSLMVMLVLIAVISLILGLGLPTTANYIVVSSLMAPVVMTLGAQHGMIVPLIAVHLFVFYFGIMADITPPVGLAAFAASAISKADPIKTGIQAFKYAMLTAVLPFMFIFNTDIILVGIDSFWHAAFIFVVTLTAMCFFAAAIQGYFFARNKPVETLLLVLAAFSLARPDFWQNRYAPEFIDHPGSEITKVIDSLQPGEQLRLKMAFTTMNGEQKQTVVVLDIPGQGSGQERLEEAGLTLVQNIQGETVIEMVSWGSAAEEAGLDFDQVILAAQQPNQRFAKQLVYIPALFIAWLVYMLQSSRRRKQKTQSIEAETQTI